MSSVAKDVARRVTVGELNGTDGRQLILDRLADWHATFAVAVDTSDPGEVEVTVSVPMSDAAIIDVGDFLSGNLTAQIAMRVE